VTAAANALYGLLPNIEGAGVGVCRLYEGVVRSRALYGAPGMGGGSAEEATQLAAVEEVAEDYVDACN
jgi:hypothetical protein